MKISELIKEAHATAREKGWHDEPRTFGEVVALLHSEVSEALEAYRIAGLHYYERADKPEGVPTELADVIIRIADFCGEKGIDLEMAIAQKMAFNRTRPYRHGGKKL